jgi:hypothetical protein
MPLALTILVFAILAAWCLWLAFDSLRSGAVEMHVRYGRTRHFSRRANPRGYWTVVGAYLALGLFSAVVAVARLILG